MAAKQAMAALHTHDDYNDDIDIDVKTFIQLRRLQSQSGCATSTLKRIWSLGSKTKSNFDCTMRRADRLLNSVSGAQSIRLHGCVGCHKHVFTMNDAAKVCPACSHPRYSTDQQPNEV